MENVVTDSAPLPWQTAVAGQLRNLLDQDRLPHALLLEGSPGTGRLGFANNFARMLLCEAPGESGPCGVCKSCTLNAGGAHSDFLEIAPEEPGKAIGIDAVRRAIRFVATTAALGDRKVLLVQPAEAMTVAAFNAFLKCLEEPAPGTFIVMVAPRGYPLPATIRSRCQRWDLPKPDHEQALTWLRDYAARGADPVAEDDLRGLVELTDGRPLLCAELLHDDSTPAILALQAHARRKQILNDAQLEAVAGQVEVDRLLDTLEALVSEELKARDLSELRSESGLNGFKALDSIQKLRGARRAGSNPNADLLVFTALRACNGLWAP